MKSLKNWMKYDTNLKNIYDTLDKKVDELIEVNPEAFGRAKTKKEWHQMAYEDIQKEIIELETKHRRLRGRYAFLLHRLKQTAPKTYKTFKELETNDI